MPAEREKRSTRKTIQYNDNLLHSEGVRVYHYLFKSLHYNFLVLYYSYHTLLVPLLYRRMVSGLSSRTVY